MELLKFLAHLESIVEILRIIHFRVKFSNKFSRTNSIIRA